MKIPCFVCNGSGMSVHYHPVQGNQPTGICTVCEGRKTQEVSPTQAEWMAFGGVRGMHLQGLAEKRMMGEVLTVQEEFALDLWYIHRKLDWALSALVVLDVKVSKMEAAFLDVQEMGQR